MGGSRRLWLGTGRLLAGGGSCSRRHLHDPDKLICLSQYLLHFLEARAARHTAPEVLLNLAHLSQVELPIQQRVQGAFVKMRHSSPVLPSDTLPPAAGVPGPG